MKFSVETACAHHFSLIEQPGKDAPPAGPQRSNARTTKVHQEARSVSRPQGGNAAPISGTSTSMTT